MLTKLLTNDIHEAPQRFSLNRWIILRNYMNEDNHIFGETDSYRSLTRPQSQPPPDLSWLSHPGPPAHWSLSHPERFVNRPNKMEVVEYLSGGGGVRYTNTKYNSGCKCVWRNYHERRAETWDEEHIRSCSLLAPSGGVILLKRPVRRRGVGTNKVFCACRDKTHIKYHRGLILGGKIFSEGFWKEQTWQKSNSAHRRY